MTVFREAGGFKGGKVEDLFFCSSTLSRREFFVRSNNEFVTIKYPIRGPKKYLLLSPQDMAPQGFGWHPNFFFDLMLRQGGHPLPLRQGRSPFFKTPIWLPVKKLLCRSKRGWTTLRSRTEPQGGPGGPWPPHFQKHWGQGGPFWLSGPPGPPGLPWPPRPPLALPAPPAPLAPLFV